MTKQIRNIIFLLFISSNISFSQVHAPIKHWYGLKIIECDVEGVKMDFIFDTGASTTLISLENFNKMVSNGFSGIPLESTEIQTADGSIVNAIVYEAKKMIIHGIELENVKFSVINKPNTSNLLGQNIFRRFQSYEIKSNTIVFYPHDYMGNDFYKSRGLEDSLNLIFEDLFKFSFESVFNYVYTNFKLYDGGYKITKPGNSVKMHFNIFFKNPYEFNYKAATDYEILLNKSKIVTQKLIKYTFDDSEMSEKLKELIIQFNITQFKFIYTISFKDGDREFPVSILTSHIIKHNGELPLHNIY